MAKLRETGRYDDYKRKQAECVKQWRLKAKHNEKYLPPEIQLHIINERRRAIRERVKRCRERKQQKSTEMEAIGKVEPIESINVIEEIEQIHPMVSVKPDIV